MCATHAALAVGSDASPNLLSTTSNDEFGSVEKLAFVVEVEGKLAHENRGTESTFPNETRRSSGYGKFTWCC